MSSINSVRFSCTALAGTGKKGILKPDSEGYYDTVVGGLNVFNSAGELYVAEGARNLFEESGLLIKRLRRGRLRGEYAHPKQAPGESDRDFMRRIFLIDENKVSTFFREIYLDDKSLVNEQGKPIIAIRAKLKPYGPYAKCLQDAIDDPYQNVCFSIRAFTDDYRVRGINQRTLKTIVTWDQVGDPGIANAEKYSSPSLESIQAVEHDERIFTKSQLQESFSELEQVKIEGFTVAQESALINVDELFTSLGWRSTTPHYTKW